MYGITPILNNINYTPHFNSLNCKPPIVKKLMRLAYHGERNLQLDWVVRTISQSTFSQYSESAEPTGRTSRQGAAYDGVTRQEA
ncbi:unnamed protein product [Kluyveromyces dobzhanskii CBS 2104]|uniref:WGS project CCBQ000000000 data, contig 00015 n=1 Tax=Kluyveromyces dobzhanskii CBS 2104 TaxID=1427455 RepID=A0A0A8L943_9SACH|nr:unnamed protein product [Kluyveromyces dobzhanskii CBS 2104]